MNIARFLVSWLLTAVVMFGLFYGWHGMFLTDFEKLAMPLAEYLPLAFLAQLVIGLVLYGLIAYLDLGGRNLSKGLLLGGVLGFFIYLIAFAFGVSFQPNPDLSHLAVDFCWQMFEQGAGGLVCGLIYGIFTFQMEARRKALA